MDMYFSCSKKEFFKQKKGAHLLVVLLFALQMFLDKLQYKALFKSIMHI